ncbi:MAG: alpha/beta hydrolase [Dehalococcoidia bacterium]
MATLRSRWVMAGNVKTHYTESGDDGPVIVGLHGGGAGSSGESGMGPLMPGLGEDFRYIAPDSVGGYGLTDVNAPAPFGIQSRVDHLEDFVDALCLDKFSIMGNSQGAWAAARYALLHPDRIEKIVLVASFSIVVAMGVTRPPTPGMAVLAAYDGTKEKMRDLLSAIVSNQDMITDELVDRRNAAATRPGAMEKFKEFGRNTRRFQTEAPLSLNFDMRATLPALTKAIPTIFLWGEDDQFAPMDAGQEIEPMLPDVKFHWIANAGHQAQTDQPQLTTQIIKDFILAPVPA